MPNACRTHKHVRFVIYVLSHASFVCNPLQCHSTANFGGLASSVKLGVLPPSRAPLFRRRWVILDNIVCGGWMSHADSCAQNEMERAPITWFLIACDLPLPLPFAHFRRNSTWRQYWCKQVFNIQVTRCRICQFFLGGRMESPKAPRGAGVGGMSPPHWGRGLQKFFSFLSQTVSYFGVFRGDK